MTPNNLEFVILAAGKSTRNYPHSKGIPHKSLTPFGSIKIIDFIMQQIILAGGRHITIVVSDTAAIESFKNCFATEPETEQKFQEKGDLTSLKLLKSLYLPEDIDLKYLIQPQPKGTGHAVGMVYQEIQNSGRNIVMIWPDDIILSNKHAQEEEKRIPIYKRAIDKYITMNGKGNLGITRHVNDPSRWGIIDDGYFKEKPKQSTSNNAAFGLFIFDKHVCEKLMQSALKMNKGEEVEGLIGTELAFAHALNSAIKENPGTEIEALSIYDTDTYLDCGQIQGYEKALLYTLLTESEFQQQNLEFIKQLTPKLYKNNNLEEE